VGNLAQGSSGPPQGSSVVNLAQGSSGPAQGSSVGNLAQGSSGPAQGSSVVNLAQGTSLPDLLGLVDHLHGATEKEVQEVVSKLSLAIFSKKELIQCSRTGKRSVKSGDSPRPSLDQRKLQTLQKLVLDKCPLFTKEQFVKKFENIQKMLRRGPIDTK
jgi:hypothetical protein